MEVESALRSQTGLHRLYHYHRTDAKYLSSTLTAQAEMLEEGAKMDPSQQICSFLYHVYEGEGATTIQSAQGETKVVMWKCKDTFAVPAWAKVAHTNLDNKAAFLFAITDRPLVENLGLHKRQ